MSEQSLGAAADELNEALRAVAIALRGLKLGVRASVSLGDAGALAFGKFNQEWQLLHVVRDTEGPLTSASREVRIMATAHLPRLLSALYAECGDELKRVREATDAALAFAKSILTTEAA